MNSSLTSFASLASVGLALVACGGGGSDPGTITTAAATASVEHAADLAAAMTSQDGEDAAVAVQAMIALNQGILLPGDASPRVLGKPALDALAPLLHGTVTCGESGCVFDHFGDDNPEYAWEMNGTITRTVSGYEFALDYDISVPPMHLHWRMDGWMTITPSQIDGEVRIAAYGETSDAEVEWEVTVVYDAILLDANGCAIGGDIDARSIFTSEGRTIFDLEGVITFGPACGEIH